MRCLFKCDGCWNTVSSTVYISVGMSDKILCSKRKNKRATILFIVTKAASLKHVLSDVSHEPQAQTPHASSVDCNNYFCSILKHTLYCALVKTKESRIFFLPVFRAGARGFAPRAVGRDSSMLRRILLLRKITTLKKMEKKKKDYAELTDQSKKKKIIPGRVSLPFSDTVD